jgi:hypothetical protein
VPTSDEDSTLVAAGPEEGDADGGISPWWLLAAVVLGGGLVALYFLRRGARDGEHAGGNASGF